MAWSQANTFRIKAFLTFLLPSLMTVPASTNRHLSSDAVPQAGAGKNSDSALPSLRFSSTNWLSLSLPETSLSTTVRKTGEGNHIWMDFCHRSWCLTSELTSHSKEIISQWHCTPRVYSFPLTFIHHDWKSCTVFPASPLFLCEERGCLDFMGPEGKHTLISPWTHKCIPMSIPPTNLSTAGSYQQLCSMLGNVPLTPQLLWHQISFGESLHPLMTKPAWCAEGFLPLFAFGYLRHCCRNENQGFLWAGEGTQTTADSHHCQVQLKITTAD